MSLDASDFQYTRDDSVSDDDCYDPFFGYVHSWTTPAPIPAPAPTPAPAPRLSLSESSGGSDAATEIDSCSSIDPTIPDAEMILSEVGLCEHISTDLCTFGEPCVATMIWSVEGFIAQFHPAVFKIGITSDPSHRYYNSTYGYNGEGYTAMAVLHSGTPMHGCTLERGLIAALWGRQGLQNIQPGGESAPNDDCCCFTYCVAAWGAAGSLLRAAHRKRHGV